MPTVELTHEQLFFLLLLLTETQGMADDLMATDPTPSQRRAREIRDELRPIIKAAGRE